MSDETLREKQFRFTRLTVLLLSWAHDHGYELVEGDGYRHPETCGPTSCGMYGYMGRNSLHNFRLAHDWHIFRDGTYLSDPEECRPLGEYWESLGGTWGGRFQDGNHYSIEHNGIA